MEKLAPLLEKLAEKLGTTVDHLWKVLIAQAPIYATYYIIMGVLLVLASIAYVFILIKSFKPKLRELRRYSSDRDTVKETLNWWKYQDRSDANDGVVVFAAVAATLVGVILIIANLVFWCDSLYSIFTALFNPEYWALQVILSSLK